MEFRNSKMTQYYYAAVLIMIAAIAGFGIKYYWANGPMNMENIRSVFEASIQVDELKNKNYVKEIKTLVDNDRVRDAVKVMENLEKEFRSLNSVKEIDEFKTLEDNTLKSKEALNGLLSYPELSSVILVLGNKVAHFENFVVQNNWRTLTRMSRRIKAKIIPGRVRSPGFFNLAKISSLNKSITKDIDIMEKVTRGSILSRQEKQSILIKIKTLKTEVGMLSKYLRELRTFNKSFKGLKTSYASWMKVLEPSISYKQIKFEESAQNLLMGLIGFIGFIVLALFGGAFVHRISIKKNNDEVERTVLKTIKDGLIPLNNKIIGQPSKRFSEELDKYREHVHKRMSFGSVFQDAIPFSSLLLDSNLKVTWANSLFYETWKLEDHQGKEGSISWDYLQQYTNLGDNDPVLAAHNSQIAGIYQVQVKKDEYSEAVPYEMYVSPVEYIGQSRIMIMFYPLRSVEETLSNQTKSIVSPVLRTLNALDENRFNSDFCENISKDYDIAGINEVFERFKQHNDLILQQRNGLLAEIERLENNLYDQYKLVDDMKVVFGQKEEINNRIMKSFGETKNSIISIVDLRSEMEGLLESSVKTSKKLFEDESELLGKSVEAIELLGENVKAFEAVTRVRDEFKQLKSSVDDFRSRIVQSLDKAILSQRNKESYIRVERNLGIIKEDIRDYEKTLGSFGKVMTNLDVSLSKVQLIMAKGEAPDFEGIKKRFNIARETIKSDINNVSRLSQTGEMKDVEMITALKDLVGSFKEGRSKLNQLNELVVLSQSQNKEEVIGSDHFDGMDSSV